MKRITAMTQPWLVIGALAAGGLYSCATPSSKSPTESNSSSKDVGKETEEDDVQISDNFSNFTLSTSNNPLTNKTVNKDKAQSLVKDIQGDIKNPTFKDRKQMIALMAVKAVAGFTVDNMLDTAQALVNVEMSKDIRREMPEVARMQIILSAIRSRNFALAEYFMADLADSKNKRIKAALSTAEGFIAYLEDRIPEAVYFWNEALKHDPDYEPALLNIGYTALRFGDYVTARKMLSQLNEDWFALTGVLIAARLQGDKSTVEDLCGKVASKDNNKPARLSCALHKYEGEGKYDEAIKELQDLVKDSPTAPAIDEKAFRVIARIEEDKNKKKEKEAAEKAKKDEERRKLDEAKKQQEAANKAAAAQQAAPAQGGGEGERAQAPAGQQPAAGSANKK